MTKISSIILLLGFTLFSCLSFNREQVKIDYASYYGGSGYDGQWNWLRHLELDAAGNVYFSFETFSKDLFTTEDAAFPAYRGGNRMLGAEDSFICVFHPETRRVTYASYLGGAAGPEFISQITAVGNRFYVVGNTGSEDFPVTSDAFDPEFNGPRFRHADAFLACFEEGRLDYATFFGTEGYDFLSNVLVNSKGELILVGEMENPAQLPITCNLASRQDEPPAKIVIIRLNPETCEVISFTLLGAGKQTEATLGKDDSIYVTGVTTSRTGPGDDLSPATHRLNRPGDNDSNVFISRVSADGSRILSHTLIGGSKDEAYPLLTLDAEARIFVYARTESPDFPLSADACDNSFDGQTELFVARLSADGASLLQSTFLGGNQVTKEFLGNMILSPAGDVILCGSTDAPDHPVTTDAVNPVFIGGTDIFITVMNDSLSELKYSTYFGGAGSETNPLVAVDSRGELTGICTTNSRDFPVTEDAFQRSVNSYYNLALFTLETGELLLDH